MPPIDATTMARHSSKLWKKHSISRPTVVVKAQKKTIETELNELSWHKFFLLLLPQQKSYFKRNNICSGIQEEKKKKYSYTYMYTYKYIYGYKFGFVGARSEAVRTAPSEPFT